MTEPAAAASLFLRSCLLGLPLGCWYDFLRPLRPRFTHLSDFVFMVGAVYLWLYQSFAICRGDIRWGYFSGFVLGAFVWELTAGMVLRPVFRWFWQILAQFWRIMLIPGKIFFQKTKILFASGEKWVTIRWNNRRQKRRSPRGGTHGRTGTGPYGPDALPD